MVYVFKTVLTTTPGATSVAAPGGISVVQIITVQRSGTQYDKVALGSLNDGVTRQWAYHPFFRQIRFPTAIPFNDGEKIYVMYKVVA